MTGRREGWGAGESLPRWRRNAELSLEPTLGIEPRTPSLRVAPDRACDPGPASTQAYTVPQSPLFLMGMLADQLATTGVETGIR